MSNCDCDRCSGRAVRARLAEDEHERRLERARREGREQVYARLVGTANEHLAGAIRRHFGDVPKVQAYTTWRKVEDGAPKHAHFAVVDGEPAPTVYKRIDEHARPVVTVTGDVQLHEAPAIDRVGEPENRALIKDIAVRRGATDLTPILDAFEVAERHLEEVRREALQREEERLLDQMGSLKGEGD